MLACTAFRRLESRKLLRYTAPDGKPNLGAPPLLSLKDTRFRRRMHYLRHLLKRALEIRNGYPLREFGDKSSGCAYSIRPDGLGPQSIVYSGGVGKDVSFEHVLVRNFGCGVVLFDPSPIGLATMRLRANQNPLFAFFQLAWRVNAEHCASLPRLLQMAIPGLPMMAPPTVPSRRNVSIW